MQNRMHAILTAAALIDHISPVSGLIRITNDLSLYQLIKYTCHFRIWLHRMVTIRRITCIEMKATINPIIYQAGDYLGNICGMEVMS